MSGDGARSVDQLRDEASKLIDGVGNLTGDERTGAEARLRTIRGELSRRSKDGDQYDPDAIDAGRSVDGWMRHAGVPTEPPATGTKEPQTKSGAGGRGATAPPTHGGVPAVPFTGDAMDRMRDARCKLCSYLRDHPRPDPLTADAASRAKWDADRKKLIVDMILAEEEMLDAVARHWVPYSPEDEATLDKGWDAIGKLRGKFDKIAENDATVADYTKRLSDIETIHDGLKQGLTGIKSDQGFKSEKVVKGLTDGVGKLADRRELHKMTDAAEKLVRPGTGTKAIKQMRDATAALEKGASRTSANLAKMGGKGNFGQAMTGFAGGMYRLLHQETQRALMKVEGANHELVSEVMDAREQLAEAHAQVIDRRQTKALEIVNEYLEREGQPPFQLHSMSEKDFANELDGRLQELHMSDSVERNFGTEASKRTTGLPTSKLGRFRKQHGKVFGADEEAELKAWCEQHCPKKKVAAAPPVKKKTGLMIGGAVVGVTAIVIGGVFAFGGGDEPAEEPADEPVALDEPVEEPADEPAEEPAEEPVEEPAVVDEPADEPVDEPAEEPEIVLAPMLEQVGLSACPGVFHTPPDGYPGSLSFVMIHGMLIAIPVAADPMPNGFLLLETPGADVPVLEVAVVDGLFSEPMPISSYGPYEITPTVFTSDSGTAVEVVAPPIFVDVTATEGPVGGCIPPQDLSDDERRQIIDEGQPTDVGGGQGGAGQGGDPGGGPAIIVDPPPDAIPPPEDILGPYREFLTRFDLAHREGDVDALLATLSPTTLSLYGEAQCRSYLEGVVGSVGELFLVDGRLDSPWTFDDQDGGDASAEVFGSFELDVELTLTESGERTDTQLHLLDTPDGVVWFTDCGDALAP